MIDVNLDKLYRLLEDTYAELDKMKELITKLQVEARKEALKDVPGVEGVFDGKFLVTDANEKIEIPANYAAKSRVVYGDRLKAYEEDGKKLFKQVEKVLRRKVPAVVSRKEGKFYALTEYGDHELSTAAVEFNNIQVNDKIQVILPETDLKAPFAALDKTLVQTKIQDGDVKKVEKKKEDLVVKNQIKVSGDKSEVPQKEVSNNLPKEKEQDREINKEFVMDLTTKDMATKVTKETKKEIIVPEKKEVVQKPAESKPISNTKPTTNSRPSPSTPRIPFVLEDDDLR